MSVTLPRRAILAPEDRALLRRVSVAQLSFSEAADVTQLHPEILKQLVRFRVLPGAIAGDMGAVDADRAVEVAAQLAAHRAPVEGNPILVAEAAEKYGFSKKSIYKWVEEGWVKVLQPEPKVQVNEGDLAFARALSKLQGQVVGRAVFPARPRSGRPRKQKHES